LFLLFLLSYTLSYVIYTLSLHDALPIFNRSHALDDIAEIGRMMGFAPDNACDEAAVDACIAGISALLKTIGIPSSLAEIGVADRDRKSTRLNSSHVKMSYAVFCLKKKRK